MDLVTSRSDPGGGTSSADGGGADSFGLSRLRIDAFSKRARNSPRVKQLQSQKKNFTKSIVSPGTRQYLATDYNDHAATVGPLDNGDQYLLRAVLLENTTLDPAQLQQVSRMYEKSIQIRDDDHKLALRLYNYASFSMWRLRDVQKAIALYRSALQHTPDDPELSFALAEALHLSIKKPLQRAAVVSAELKQARREEDDEEEEEEEEDEEGEVPAWAKPYTACIEETEALFELALETYEEDVSVVLAAADFYVDVHNVEKATEMYNTAMECDIDETTFALRRKTLSAEDVRVKVGCFHRDVLKDCTTGKSGGGGGGGGGGGCG
jgi:tetratricopeptide (TPR) repeat protein